MTPEAITQRHPVVLVAGGTGGHVFPAEALAAELRSRGHTLALFTDQRGVAWSGALGNVVTHSIRAGRVSGVSLIGRLRGMADLALGGLQSRRLLARLQPSMVVGFGGYASVSAMMAASTIGVPTVIHEQNALIGRANRLLAPRVTAIATSFPEVERLRAEDEPKTVFTGNPVREAVRTLRDMPFSLPDRGAKLNLLVTGGSQGATVFSRIVPDAIANLTQEARARINLAQQCRKEDIEDVRAAYAAIGLKVDLAPFFDDLAERLGQAHLVICRSGASTCAELTTAGRPAVLVPYPHAADDHQMANARAVETAGGAEVIPESDFTADLLAARLKLMIEQPGHLGSMAGAARNAGHADAAGNLALLVEGLVEMQFSEPGRAAA